MKVLHVLYQSFPHITGSSTRSRDLLTAQKSIGINPVVITSPFQKGIEEVDVLYGVKHYRTFEEGKDTPTSEKDKGLRNRIRRILRMPYFIREVKKVLKAEKPEVIHAHATFFCGLSAAIIGYFFKLPVIYEVRSIWEQRILEQNKSVKAKMQVKLISFLEVMSMRLSNHVVAISKHLKEDIEERGISTSKITVVGNAVNLEMIKDSGIEEKLMLKNAKDFIFSYIGGISSIEGLDVLIKAFAKLSRKGYSNKLFIYGDGVYLGALLKLKEELHADNVHFKGRVAHEFIYKAYNSIDVIVNPRRNIHINNTVTPLKPLEAMAYRKLVIGSDVGGLREIIQDGKTGILFKADDVDDLYSKIIKLIGSSRDELQSFRNDAYNYVINERNWLSNAKKYCELYKSLIS